MKNYILLALGVIAVVFIFRITAQRDYANNAKFDKCMEVYKNSGAPAEAREQIIKDCYNY